MVDSTSIISLSPRELRSQSNDGQLYSCGIHPWYVEKDVVQFDDLAKLVKEDRVVAIGEIGLDKLCDTPFEKQIDIFEKQIQLAEKVGKPIIIHCVKAWDDLIRIYQASEKSIPWIIHGFRGKPEQVKQLVRLGFYLSIGERYNEDALKVIPLNKLLIETDMSEISIDKIYACIARDLGLETVILSNIITCNVKKVFR